MSVSCACLLCSQISVIIHTINTFYTAQSIKTKIATWKHFNLNSSRIRSQNCRHQNYMVVTVCAVWIWAHVTWDTKYWKLKWIHKYFQILGHCPVYVSHKCISWNKDVELISWYMINLINGKYTYSETVVNKKQKIHE